ncbi:MAG: glutamate--tRNA ligase [Bacteroidota bacterium]|jgi:glutamyl-tRNA synthetase|nr:glutamate--tRNA ligase [Sphingobacteriales bacterium]
MEDRRVRVRFAPSPTGPLHIGGVRTALYNYLLAKKHGGDFILRIEDTDQTRFVPGAEEYIIESLKWLGITPNEGLGFGDGPHAPYRQSERKPMYRQYAEHLIASGHAYYAFDTAEELESMRERLKASNVDAKYDAITRAAMKNSLTLPEDEVKRRLESGDPYVVRIKLPRKDEVKFHDEIRGWVSFNTSQMDDKVLFKSDGMPTYHLANVVDDYLMQISHVIRGEEWLPSAPLHVLLYRYLGWEAVMPKFAHLPLLLKPEGNGKLSKRDGDRLGFPVFPLEWKDPASGEISSGYRETGYLPDAVVNLLAFLGWNPGTQQELFSVNELVGAFGLDRVSKSGAKFDLNKAKWFNQQYIRKTDEVLLASALNKTLQQNSIQAGNEYVLAVCRLVKEKITFISELWTYSHYFFKLPESYDEGVVAKRWNEKSAPVTQNLITTFGNLPAFDATAVEAAYNETLAKNEVANKDFLQLFRVMLSGVGSGPPVFEMAALFGKENTIERLQTALNILSSTKQP